MSTPCLRSCARALVEPAAQDEDVHGGVVHQSCLTGQVPGPVPCNQFSVAAQPYYQQISAFGS